MDAATTTSAPVLALPGQEQVTLGDRQYIAAPLPFKTLRSLAAVLARVGNGLGVEQQADLLGDMARVITIGLGITQEELESLPAVSVTQLGAAYRAIMRVSGMEAEIERNLGEAMRRVQALMPPPAPTPGTPSTPTSAPPPAGSGA